MFDLLVKKAARVLPSSWSGRPVRSADADRAVEPLDVEWGRLPASGAPRLPWAGAAQAGEAVLAELSHFDWTRCPVTGATLPDGHSFSLPWAPGAWAEARVAQRHGWFLTLSRAWADTGDPRYADAASRMLAAWFGQSRLEVGIGWSHASDAALRVVAWSLGAGWLGEELDADLRRRMAGSALLHGAWLQRNVTVLAADHRRLAQAAGLVVAGLTWPGLPGARAWWSEGLSLLNHTLDAVITGDGAPAFGSPRALLRSVELVLVARALARSNGVAFPAGADAALLRAAGFLRHAGGDLDTLPAVGEHWIEPALPPWGVPAHLVPWHTLAAEGVVAEGSPAAAKDGTAALLAGRVAPVGPPAGDAKGWTLRVFREGGWAVLHGEVRGRASRLTVVSGPVGRSRRGPFDHADVGQVLWHLAGVAVLEDPGSYHDQPELRLAAAHNVVRVAQRGAPRDLGGHHAPLQVDLTKARVDDRTGSVALAHDAFGVTYKREVTLEGSRLVVVDRFERLPERVVDVRFQLGLGWAVEQTAKGLQASSGDLRLAITLPEELPTVEVEKGRIAVGSVVREAPLLVARGTVRGDVRLRSILEIR